MGGIQKLGFFAYPDGYPIIGEAIEGAVQLAREAPMVLKPWKAMEIVGFRSSTTKSAPISLQLRC